MASARFPINIYDDYHAHVYFDHETRDFAADLCAQAGELFGVAVGRVHERPVGPHPCFSCQLAFDGSQFDGLITWLEVQRNGLTVLVHGITGDALEDHTINAYWLGESVELKLAMFGG